MQESSLLEKDYLKFDEPERNVEKIKFCIISSFKSQMSRNNLLMFTLDNLV